MFVLILVSYYFNFRRNYLDGSEAILKKTYFVKNLKLSFKVKPNVENLTNHSQEMKHYSNIICNTLGI